MNWGPIVITILTAVIDLINQNNKKANCLLPARYLGQNFYHQKRI